jgi:hypothetical protein
VQRKTCIDELQQSAASVRDSSRRYRLGFVRRAGRHGALRIRRIDDEFCGGVDI